MDDEKLKRCNFVRDEISNLIYSLDCINDTDCVVKVFVPGKQFFLNPSIYGQEKVSKSQSDYLKAVSDVILKELKELEKEYDEL